jgi:hypothetical protein
MYIWGDISSEGEIEWSDISSSEGIRNEIGMRFGLT